MLCSGTPFRFVSLFPLMFAIELSAKALADPPTSAGTHRWITRAHQQPRPPIPFHPLAHPLEDMDLAQGLVLVLDKGPGPARWLRIISKPFLSPKRAQGGPKSRRNFREPPPVETLYLMACCHNMLDFAVVALLLLMVISASGNAPPSRSRLPAIALHPDQEPQQAGCSEAHHTTLSVGKAVENCQKLEHDSLFCTNGEGT